MAKKRKLLEKIARGSKNIRFAEFIGLVEGFGFTLNRISGSHHIFEHPEVPQGISLQSDKNSQAKPYQMKQFLRVVEKYNLRLDEDEQGNDDS
jgi:predicted RNA binding protein YcfA (HicA-like mRNA interferase family)